MTRTIRRPETGTTSRSRQPGHVEPIRRYRPCSCPAGPELYSHQQLAWMETSSFLPRRGQVMGNGNRRLKQNNKMQPLMSAALLQCVQRLKLHFPSIHPCSIVPLLPRNEIPKTVVKKNQEPFWQQERPLQDNIVANSNYVEDKQSLFLKRISSISQAVTCAINK